MLLFNMKAYCHGDEWSNSANYISTVRFLQLIRLLTSTLWTLIN